jgi:hypothetical protein
MLEALCRQFSTTLDIVHAEDGSPITQRTSGLGAPPVISWQRFSGVYLAVNLEHVSEIRPSWPN